jgi:hypothetical protein
MGALDNLEPCLGSVRQRISSKTIRSSGPSDMPHGCSKACTLMCIMGVQRQKGINLAHPLVSSANRPSQGPEMFIIGPFSHLYKVRLVVQVHLPPSLYGPRVSIVSALSRVPCCCEGFPADSGSEKGYRCEYSRTILILVGANIKNNKPRKQ